MVCVMGRAGVANAAQDVVITITGDRLVGEIIRVEKDVLIFSTGYSDADFKIEWDKVASIESTRQFLVETFDGRRLSGSLKADPNTKGAVQVGGTTVPLAQVAAVQPFERSFWSRFDSGLDFGFSMTRANSAKQFSLGSNLSYRDADHYDALFANVFSSSQENAPDTQRWDVGNDFRRFLGSRWYVNTTQDFLNSEEQGLDLRTTIGGGAGRYLMRSSSQHLAVGGGLAWTNENYTDATLPAKDSAEGYLSTEFMTEKLKITDLITRFTYYPSLTIDNRYRLSYRFDLDFNLPGDWYFRVGFFDNFDSKPPESFSKNDYGWSNAFGFKF
jgi:putative salt-induced outer membrane protein YdiY